MRIVSIMRVGALALALTTPALSMAYAGGDVDRTEHSLQFTRRGPEYQTQSQANQTTTSTQSADAKSAPSAQN